MTQLAASLAFWFHGDGVWKWVPCQVRMYAEKTMMEAMSQETPFFNPPFTVRALLISPCEQLPLLSPLPHSMPSTDAHAPAPPISCPCAQKASARQPA